MLRKGMKVLFIITSLLLIPMQGIVHAEEGTEPQPSETENCMAEDCPQEEEKEPVITVEPTASPDSNTEASTTYDLNLEQEPVKLENAELQSVQTFNTVNNPSSTLHTIEWGPLEHGSIRIIAGSDELLSGYDELTAGTKVEVHLDPDPGYRYKEGSLVEKTTPAMEFTKHSDTVYTFIMPDADVTLSLEFEPIYYQDDVNAMNDVIRAHPEAFDQKLIDHPEQWDFAKWELVADNALGIKDLDLSDKELKGTLDVESLVYLETLSCAHNNLTELLFNYTAVKTLDCSQNQLKTLTIYYFTIVNCEGNPMEGLEIYDFDGNFWALSVNVSNKDKQAGNTAYIQSFNGSITSTPTYTLKAVPAVDYRFSGWEIGTSIYINSTTTLDWEADNTTIQAVFEIPIQILLPPDEIVLKKGQTLHITPTVLPENVPDKHIEFGIIGKTSFWIDSTDPNAFYLKSEEVGEEHFVLFVGKNGNKTITVKVIDRDFIQPAIIENMISGVNGSYDMKSTLSFTAAGSGLDNPEPLWEDWRWVPVRWYIDNQNVDAIQGTFSSGNDQSASLTGLPAGNHELIVEFQKEVYNNWNWEPAETERLSTVFSVTSPIPTPTVTPSPKPSEPEANPQSVTVPSSPSPWIIKKPKTTVKATATPEPTNTPTPTETPMPTEKPVTPAPESSTVPIPSEVKKSGLPGWTAAAVISAAVIAAGGVLLLKRRLK